MDDLSDLNFTTTPGGTGGSRPAGRSAFDYLSSGGHYTQSTRPSPSGSPAPRQSSSFPSTSGGQVRAGGKPAATTANGDAFDSLFGDGAGKESQAQGHRSMAEQLAAQHQSSLFGGLAGTGRGANLSPALGGTRSTSPGLLAPTRTSASSSRPVSPASFTSPPARSSAASPLSNVLAPKGARASSDPWDFDMLPASSSPAPSAPAPGPAPAVASSSKRDSWGIEFDDTSTAVSNERPRRSPRKHDSGLLDLDGSPEVHTNRRRRGSIALDAEDEGDDLLGALGRPVDLDAVRRQAASVLEAEAARQRSRRHPSSPPSRSPAIPNGGRASPPPHVLGQVVEMGFGIMEARCALVQSRNPAGGWDVEAAVTSLVGGAGASDGAAGPPISLRPDDLGLRGVEGRRPRHDEEGAGFDSGSDDEPPDPVLPRRPSPSRGSRHRPPARPQEGDASLAPSSSANVKDLSDQASVLYAQASAYGMSALGRASAFWKQSRAALEKALEERDGDSSAAEAVSRRQIPRLRSEGANRGEEGKPKWMRDAERAKRLAQAEARRPSVPGSPPQAQERPGPSFHDDDDSDGQRDGALSEAMLNGRVDAARSPAPPGPARQPSPDLFGSAVSAVKPTPAPTERREYVSSARRRGPDRSNRHAGSAAAAAQPPPKPAPVPARRLARQLPTASAAELAASLAQREKGNEAFKRGQFGEAEIAYGRALDSLPDGCWERVVVWNNRAMARLKNGDGKGVTEDTSEAIALICGVTLPSAGTKIDLSRLDIDSTAAPNGVDLRDQLGKALSRRARAAEARERWIEASEDWEAIRGAGEAVVRSAGGSNVVVEAVARCRKLAGGTNGEASTTGLPRRGTRSAPPRSRPPPRPVISTSQQPSEAVSRLRSANDAAEIEAAQRLAVKDEVDAKLMNWKGGKETNLRALIASLDTVLWPELGWKKVGMGELLTEGQVKARYVRAIAKMHPDKIPKSATVEQQMIAKSVFAVLNEAWLAMQG